MSDQLVRGRLRLLVAALVALVGAGFVVAFSLPGAAQGVEGLRVEAESFDVGEPGVAHDDTDGQRGNVVSEGDDAENAVDVFAIENSGASGELIGRTRDGEFVQYTISIEEADEFDVRLAVASGHPAPGVIQVEVDGTVLGSVDGETDRWFDWRLRNAGTVELEPGPHVIRLTWLEGAQINFDYFEVVSTAPMEPTCTSGPIEAEDAVVNGRFEVVESGAASGGAHVEVRHGTGGFWRGVSSSYVEFCLGVDEPGDYVIEAGLRTPSVKDNSFFVSVDNGAVVDFVAAVSEGRYATDFVNDRRGDDLLRSGDVAGEQVDPMTWTLESGDHNVRFYLRRDGAQLDWIRILPLAEVPVPTPIPTATPIPTPTPRPATPPSESWPQIGEDLSGLERREGFGLGTAMSADGSTVAIGAPIADANGDQKGDVRIFDWDGNQWTQRGVDIEGDPGIDLFGSSLAMSDDGNAVIVGAPTKNRDGLVDVGYVRIFDWNGESWEQRGGDLTGEANRDLFGSAVQMSASGNIIVIGAPSSGAVNESGPGYVRVYNWDGAAWTLRDELPGDNFGDAFGADVAISDDGDSIAVGAPARFRSGPGYVRLLAWDGADYVSRGEDLVGRDDGDRFGQALAMSADGASVAISAPRATYGADLVGYVRVFGWDGSGWVQRSGDIEGPSVGSFFGAAIAMSADGNRVIIGAPLHDDGFTRDIGRVQTYDWNGRAWAPPLRDVEGEAYGDQLGGSLSMSSDGESLLVGARLSTEIRLAGRARIYSRTLTPAPMPTPAESPWALRGATIEDELWDTRLGAAVAMNAEGTSVLVGAPNYGSTSNRGVQVSVDGVSVGSVPDIPEAMSVNNYQNWWDLEDVTVASDVVFGPGTHVVRVAWMGDGMVNFDRMDFGAVESDALRDRPVVDPDPSQTPFGGVAPTMQEGVEAENYDLGGPGAAFLDDDAVDGSAADYRGDEVDVFLMKDRYGYRVVDGEFLIGKTRGGEWTEYTVDAGDGGVFDISLRLGTGPSDRAGRSIVLDWNGASWQQRGDAIDSESPRDLSGGATAMSANGNVVIIGAMRTGNDDPNLDSIVSDGNARVFAWDGVQWTQRGQNIEAELSGDQAGSSVAISADGSSILVGANSNDGGIAATGPSPNTGHVRIFDWDGNQWNQRGNDIDSTVAGGRSGWSADMSDDGNSVVVGRPGYTGQRSRGLSSFATNPGGADVYDWDGSAWVQRGVGIDGAESDVAGYAVAMSADGDTVVLGAPGNDGNGANAGSVRVFDWDGSAWVQRGVDIVGDAAGDNAGIAVALSAAGDTVAIGAPGNVADGSPIVGGAGQVRILDWDGSSWLLRGPALNADVARSGAGYAVAVSADGSTVAVGLPGGTASEPSGSVQVYTNAS